MPNILCARERFDKSAFSCSLNVKQPVTQCGHTCRQQCRTDDCLIFGVRYDIIDNRLSGVPANATAGYAQVMTAYAAHTPRM